ncbi:MAG: alpha/beta hydrolase family protein [Bacillota bacterium]
MQPLVIVIALMAIILLVFTIRSKKPNRKASAGFISAAVAAFALQLVLEGARWQLYPLYLALVIMGLMLYLKAFMWKSFKKSGRWGVTFVFALLVLCSLVAVWVFPMRDVPKPSGEAPVGTVSFVIEDDDRDEPYGDDPDAKRRFKVQAWYPAETTEDYERAPWIDDGKPVLRGLSRDVGLPFFTLDHLAKIESHAYRDAPVKEASASHPVIILSHGWRGFRNLHTDIAEELASQGYVVFGIDHAYGSVATVLNDDETLLLDPEALPGRETTPDFLEYANRLVNTYAGDVTATLDFIEADHDDRREALMESLDLERIGLMGHSTGGGGAATVAASDSRIDALIGLDAWVEPLGEDGIEEGVGVPSLFLRSGEWEESYNNENLLTLIEASEDARLYQIEGTTHADFAMVHMISPLTRTVGLSGDVKSDRLTPMLRTMVNGFFDEALKEKPGRSFDPDAWKEVRKIEIE